MKDHSRNIGYDILRIIACFSVVLNHTIYLYDYYGKISTAKWLVADLIFCFCKTAVPLFLLLSGALLLKREETYKNWLKKRIIYIVTIVVAWAIIYKGERILLNFNKYSLTEMVNILLNAVKDTITTLPSWHMWYLYTLLGIYVMLPFLRKMVKNMNNKDCMV